MDVICVNEYYTLLIDELFNKHLETFYKNDLDTHKYTNVIAFENKISKFKERKHLSSCQNVHVLHQCSQVKWQRCSTRSRLRW